MTIKKKKKNATQAHAVLGGLMYILGGWMLLCNEFNTAEYNSLM